MIRPSQKLMTTWQEEIVRKADVTIIKNFLMWLDFAEDRTRRRQQVFPPRLAYEDECDAPI